MEFSKDERKFELKKCGEKFCWFYVDDGGEVFPMKFFDTVREAHYYVWEQFTYAG